MNTETIKTLLKEIKADGQKDRVLNHLSIDLIESGIFKDLVRSVLNITTYNEDDDNIDYATLNAFGFKKSEYSIATSEWYLMHFLNDNGYPDGVIQTECGLDLEEITGII